MKNPIEADTAAILFSVVPVECHIMHMSDQ